MLPKEKGVRADRAPEATVKELPDRVIFELIDHVQLYITDWADIKSSTTFDCELDDGILFDCASMKGGLHLGHILIEMLYEDQTETLCVSSGDSILIHSDKTYRVKKQFEL